ncbi:MAG: NAD(P)-dependent alcohol dehydrogenase [Rhodospirillales bacterium]|nr:NAD(P)-dependent alcohol dehydrogenase [Rhodospirillales bacterium]
MRVWELRRAFELDALEAGDRPAPEPCRGEVVLKMRAASLNYRDTLVVHGAYGPRNTLPLIPVSDGVGEVVAVGDGVTRAAVGDRVCPMFFQSWLGGPPSQAKFAASLGGPLDGVLCEFMRVAEDGIAKVPAHLSDAEAACLPCAALTAWRAVIGQGRVRPGDVVVVQGTGGVALFAVQFAKLAGARVIVLSSTDEKLARARDLGADETINYRSTPGWDMAVKDLTGGEGCDHLVELGGADTLERSIRATRIGGTISLIGVLSGAAAAIALPLIVMRHLRLQGITVGSRDDFEAMARAIDRHQLRPIVDRVFAFGQVPAAFAAFEAERPFGKLSIRIG